MEKAGGVVMIEIHCLLWGCLASRFVAPDGRGLYPTRLLVFLGVWAGFSEENAQSSGYYNVGSSQQGQWTYEVTPGYQLEDRQALGLRGKESIHATL